MNSRERMETVLSGEIPDHVPFFSTIYTDHACVISGYRFEDALMNPSLGAECMLETALKYEADAVRFHMGPELSWFHDKVVKQEGEDLRQYDKESGQFEGFFDIQGGGVLVRRGLEPPVKCLSDVSQVEVVSAQDYLDKGYFDTIGKCIASAHEKELFVVGMVSSQTINFMVDQLGDPETALLCFIDDEALAFALIDKAVEISIEKAKAFIETGTDCIYIGDSYASASVIDPDMYEKFCAPAYKKLADEIHRMGAFCYKHCCGYYTPLLEFLPSTGIDGMDGIDPTSDMSVKETKEKIGTQLTLMGGLSCLTLLQGSVDDVYQESRRCLDAGKPGGRYTLGSACAVPRYTPFENLVAARKAIEDHGYY